MENILNNLSSNTLKSIVESDIVINKEIAQNELNKRTDFSLYNGRCFIVKDENIFIIRKFYNNNIEELSFRKLSNNNVMFKYQLFENETNFYISVTDKEVSLGVWDKLYQKYIDNKTNFENIINEIV